MSRMGAMTKAQKNLNWNTLREKTTRETLAYKGG